MAGVGSVILLSTGGAPPSMLIQHHNLAGLTHDDHPQYLLIDGTRAMTGTLSIDVGSNETELSTVPETYATALQTFTGNPTSLATWTVEDLGAMGGGCYGIDVSADGQYIIAMYDWEQVAISDDWGATWSVINPTGTTLNRAADCAISDDGSHMVICFVDTAVDHPISIMTSDDYGGTWTDRTAAARLGGIADETVGWYSVDISGDGDHIVLTNTKVATTTVLVSSDTGATWDIIPLPAHANNTNGCAIDSTGDHIVIGCQTKLFTTTNRGVAWTTYSLASGSNFTKSVAISTDGSKIFAGGTNHYVYLSTNSGASFTRITLVPDFADFPYTRISGDGTMLMIGTAHPNPTRDMWISLDNGTTWSSLSMSPAPTTQGQIAMSRDGTMCVYGTYNGTAQITISNNIALAFTVGNTTVTNLEFAYGASLSLTIDNIISAFNGHAGHNTTATKPSTSTILYTANIAGTAPNAYVSTHTTDTDNVYSFGGTQLSGGFFAHSWLNSDGYINIGTHALAPTVGFMDAGDVVCGADLEVCGDLRAHAFRAQADLASEYAIEVINTSTDPAATAAIHLENNGKFAHLFTGGTEGGFVFTADTNNTGLIRFDTQTGGTYYPRMIIANDGKVGIGTDTPAALLHVLGTALLQREIEAIPGNDTLTAAESFKIVTNEGAGAQSEYTLPTAAKGLQFEFILQDADGAKIIAGAADTIRIEGTVTAAAGYIRTATIGAAIRLVAINATEWVAASFTPTAVWTFDS